MSGEPIDESEAARNRVIDAYARRVADADGDEWGFCYICAFEVAVGTDGLLVPHSRGHHDSASSIPCVGEGRPPTPQPAPECQPIKLVRLTKSVTHLNNRQRRMEDRARARARAEAMALLARPVSEQSEGDEYMEE